MGELPSKSEAFRIDEPKFNCKVCEKKIKFNFDEKEEKIEPDKIPEGVEEEIGSEEIPSLEGGDLSEAEHPEMKMEITCDCGAKYIIKKLPGETGFIVRHPLKSEPELSEKEFEEEFPPE